MGIPQFGDGDDSVREVKAGWKGAFGAALPRKSQNGPLIHTGLQPGDNWQQET
jgi:hypothetical protein